MGRRPRCVETIGRASERRLIMNEGHYPAVVLAPVIGLLVCSLGHVALARLRWGRAPYGPLIRAMCAGLAATLAMAVVAARRSVPGADDRLAFAMLDGLTYAALAWCYFHFVNLGIASLRIRVLEEIIEAGGSLQAQALRQRYDDTDMAETRIQRLLAGGHVVMRDQRFHSGRPAFLIIARTFELGRSLIIGARAE